MTSSMQGYRSRGQTSVFFCARTWVTGVLLLWLTVSVAAGPRFEPGDEVDFFAITEAGLAIADEAFAGRVVVVDFWAVWCRPCVKIIPHLKALQERHAEDGLTVISVSLDVNVAAARRVIRQRKMTWDQVIDREQESPVADMFFEGTDGGIPYCFILGRDGKLAWRGDPREIDEPLAAALAAPVPEAEGDAAENR